MHGLRMSSYINHFFIIQFARQLGLKFYETSAKTKANVQEVQFCYVIKEFNRFDRCVINGKVRNPRKDVTLDIISLH